MMTGPLVPQKSIEESLVSNLRGKWVSLDIIVAADEWKNQGKKKETFVFVFNRLRAALDCDKKFKSDETF